MEDYSKGNKGRWLIIARSVVTCCEGGSQAMGGFGASNTMSLGGNKPTFGGIGGSMTSTNTSPFGKPATSTFGSSSGGLAFGQTTTTNTSAFGSTAQQNTGFSIGGTSSFGGANNNPFASKPSTGFGATNTGFGGTSTSTGFGVNKPAFGQQQAQNAGFGSTTGGFGATNTGFGQSQQSNAFGQPQQQQSTGFGSTGFGSTAFGASNTSGSTFGSTFGSSTSTLSTPFGSAFGSTSTGFGQPQQQQQQQQPGSSFGASTFGSSPATTTGFGGFGASNTTSTSTGFGGFGSTTTQSSGFGAQNTGFGNQTPSFGSSNNQPAFGTSGFGSATQPSASPGFGFGSTTSTPAFGSATTGFGNTTGGFGSQPTQAGGFGTSTTGFGGGAGNTGFGAGTNTSFGSTATNPTGGFGSTGFGSTTTGGFGAPAAANTGFGSTTTSGFGTTGFGSTGFGQSAPATSSGFGSSLNFGQNKPATTGFGGFGGTQQPTTGFGAPSTGFGGFGGFQPQQQQQPTPATVQVPAAPSELELKYEFLRKKKDMLEISLQDVRAKPFVPESSQPSVELNIRKYRHVPHSSTRVLPRGLNGSTSRPATKALMNVAHQPVYTPTALLSRSSNKLTIDMAATPDVASELPAVVPTSDLQKPPSTPYTAEKRGTEEDASEPTGLTPQATTTPITSRPEDSPILPKPIRFEAKENKTVNVSPSKHHPILTKMEYFTIPDISVLQSMSDEELRNVPKFTVYRPSVGQIQWEGLTDVRDVNLDDVVVIENNYIAVYEGWNDDVKPPVGTSLNKPARVILFNILPKFGSSVEKIKAFPAKLRKVNEDNGSEFQYYDEETGEWCFRTLHFSRYGLDDSDSEEEENITPANAVTVKKAETRKTPVKSPSLSERLSKNPQDLLRMKLSLVGEDSIVMSAAMDLEESTPVPHISPLKSKTYHPPAAFVSAGVTASRESFTENNSYCMQLLAEAKKEHLQKTGQMVNVTTSSTRAAPTVRKVRPCDYSLFLRQSFRVGWSANGCIVHAGKPVFSADGQAVGTNIRLEKVNTIAWAEQEHNNSNCKAKLAAALDAVYDFSDRYDSAIIPLWKAPSSDPFVMEEYLRFVQLLKQLIEIFSYSEAVIENPMYVAAKVVTLFDAVYGQETSWLHRVRTGQESVATDEYSTRMPLVEDKCTEYSAQSRLESLWERRQEYFSSWLKTICSEVYVGDGDTDALSSTDALRDINVALLNNDIARAVSIAESANLMRLSLLLTQIGSNSEFRYLMYLQLQQWVDSGALTTMQPELVSIYQLLAGEALCNDECLIADKPWITSLGVLYWYCNPELMGVASALENYSAFMAEELTPPPAPFYHSDSKVLNTLYALLTQIYQGTNLAQCLLPEGYTKDPLDYSVAYLVLVLLECTGKIDCNDDIAYTVRTRFIQQLLTFDMYEYAVFVAMQIRDTEKRLSHVKELLLRYSGVEDWESNQQSHESLLVSKFGVPAELIHEATAYRTISKFSEAAYLQLACRPDEAYTVLVRKVFPQLQFLTSSSMAPMLTLLRENVATTGRNSELLNYFEFRARLQQWKHDDDVVSEVQNILAEASRLLLELKNNNFEICDDLSTADTITQVVVHDIGNYLFRTIMQLAAMDSRYHDIVHSALDRFDSVPIYEEDKIRARNLFSEDAGDVVGMVEA